MFGYGFRALKPPDLLTLGNILFKTAANNHRIQPRLLKSASLLAYHYSSTYLCCELSVPWILDAKGQWLGGWRALAVSTRLSWLPVPDPCPLSWRTTQGHSDSVGVTSSYATGQMKYSFLLSLMALCRSNSARYRSSGLGWWSFSLTVASWRLRSCRWRYRKRVITATAQRVMSTTAAIKPRRDRISKWRRLPMQLQTINS